MTVVLVAFLIGCGGADRSMERGNDALASGDPDVAAAAFGEALMASPDRPEAWLGRGKANLALGDRETALSDLRKAAALDPTSTEVWRLLAANEPDAPARLAAAERLVELAPDDLEARKVRGGLRLEAGNAVGASEDLEAWLAANADDKPTWGTYGDALLASDRPYEAWEAYQNGTNKATREPRAYSVIKRRARAGDVEALTFLRRVNEPIEPYVDQAQALYDAGRMQAALEAGRKAVAVNRDPDASRSRSLALTAAAHAGLLVDESFIATRGGATASERERAFTEIVKECEESIAIVPSTLAWRTAGFAHLQLDQDVKAIDAFTAAVALDPGDVEARRWRAIAAEHRGRYDLVVEDVDAIEAAGKLQVEDLLLRARARALVPDQAALAKADFDKAVALAESLGKAGSGLYPALKARGLFFASTGESQPARADLTRARGMRTVRDEELEATLSSLGGPIR